MLSFAEIIREALFRELGFSSIEHYARQALGFSDGKTRQFVRLCAALARLPALRAALDRGDLGWTKARTLLGVATPASEEHWLALASSCGRRELERRAAAARAAARARREAHMRRERAQRQGQDELELPEAGSPREDSSLEAGGCEGEPHGRGDAACRAGGGDGVDGAGGVDGADSRREPDEAARRNSSSTNRDGQSTAAAADDSPSSATPSSAQLPRPAIPEAAEEPIITSLRFSPLDRARYDALLERIRKLAGARSRLAPRQARREDLVLAGLALLAQAVESERRDGGDSASRPREPSPDTRVSLASNYQIIIYECATCGQAAVMTGGKMRPLSRATLEAARCDARILDTRTPQGPPNRSTVPPSLRLQLMARDGKCCRMPGCKSGMFLEAHHLIPKELGGTNELDNLILLCRACHDLVHAQPAAMRRLLASVRRRE